jgi:Fe2+ or Zn2+ uptake regulation protein
MTRHTKQRETILKALQAESGHPDARHIYEQARLRMPRISLGTVYRDLKSLTAEGLISEICDGHESRFDAMPGNHNHFHCVGCGRIVNLEEQQDGGLDDAAARQYHLKITHHQLDFFGLCPACECGE